MFTEIDKENGGVMFRGNTDVGVMDAARAAAVITRYIMENGTEFKGLLEDSGVSGLMHDPTSTGLVVVSAAAIHTCVHEVPQEVSPDIAAFKAAFRVGRLLKFGGKIESQSLAQTVMGALAIREHELLGTALDRFKEKHC